MKHKHVMLSVLMFIVVLLGAAGNVSAQSLNLDFGGAVGEAGSSTARMIQIILLMSVLSIAPGILVMVTSFTRIIVVLAFLRTALGTQQTPPNQVLIALALFVTSFIMAPVFQEAYDNGLLPLINEEISEEEAIQAAADPFHRFMMTHVRDKDLELFMNMFPDELEVDTPADTPYRVLIPAFMIGELKRAFEIGFLIFIPFLIIDMLIASVLMAMGMMMLPPVVISLPFKLIFFVLVDGWYMVIGSLVKSYGL